LIIDNGKNGCKKTQFSPSDVTTKVVQTVHVAIFTDVRENFGDPPVFFIHFTPQAYVADLLANLCVLFRKIWLILS